MAMPTRDQAIATLDDGQAAIEALSAKLSDQEMTRPATIGGGQWSAKDLLGHLAFWEELARETLADWRARRPPAVEQVVGGGREGVDAANARDQARSAGQPLEETRSRAASAQAAVVQAMRAISAEEWSAKAPSSSRNKSCLAELLGGVLGAPRHPFGHAFAHLPDLKAYVESLGHSPS